MDGRPSATTTVTMGRSSTGLGSGPGLRRGFVEGCLERIGEDDPEEERLFRNLWEDESQREAVVASLKADCDVRVGRPAG